MNVINEKLEKLERRLQTLIEQVTARFLPIEDPQAKIVEKLINSIGSSIQNDLAGDKIAPDFFVLVVNPEFARIFNQNPSLLEEMSGLIHQMGIEADLRFQKPPRVKIGVDNSLKPGAIKVLSSVSERKVNETEVIRLNNNGENQVPNNAFLIIDGVKIFSLTHPVVNIGRRVDNHIVIDDVRVSRLHAQVRANKGYYQIFDIGSSGGTFVNGVRLAQARLYPGDVISLAGVDLIYSQDFPNVPGKDMDGTQPLIPYSQR